MKKLSLFVLAVVFTFASLPLFAQENFTEGTVSRIVLFHIKPGHATEFWNDVRQNSKPIFEEYKKQGVITDYAFFTKLNSENPEDWNVGINLIYKNFAALDGLTSRTDPITLKFYGGREARAAVMAKRTEHSTVVSTFLVRSIDPKPMMSSAMMPK